MSPDKHFLWVRDLAGEIDKLIERFDTMERFRQMLQDWVDGFQKSSPCVQNPAEPLLPLPHRRLELCEKYVVLAAVHDAGWNAPQIDPWRDVDALSLEGVPYAVLKLYAAETPETDVPRLREMLADVERMLGERGQPVEAEPVSDSQPQRCPPSKSERQVEWLAMAMLLVRDHPDWSDTKIAEKVGKDKSTLSRSGVYQVAATMARGSKADLPRGYITYDPNSGLHDVEAVARTKGRADDKTDRGQRIPGSRYYREYCAQCGEAMRVIKKIVGTEPLCPDCRR